MPFGNHQNGIGAIMTKIELRRLVSQRLAALSPEARAEKSAAICREIAGTGEWRTARTVGLFAPLASEPDVDRLRAAPGTRACYPRMNGGGLLFLRVADRAALLASRWNLLEPAHREEDVVPPEEIDLLLVPGVAFTPDGHRLGRGRGFYDRFLATPGLRAITFGVCFSEQLFPALPVEAHDRPVSRLFSC